MSLSGPTLWGQLPFDVLSRIIKQSVGAKECHKNKMKHVLSEILWGGWRWDCKAKDEGFALVPFDHVPPAWIEGFPKLTVPQQRRQARLQMELE